MPKPIVTAEIPRGMEVETFKKVESFLFPCTMIVEAANPIRSAISVARRAKRMEFHREAIGVMGIIFVRFVNPVKKANKPEGPVFIDLSRRAKTGRPNKQKR
jgi:hypothetical protein